MNFFIGEERPLDAQNNFVVRPTPIGKGYFCDIKFKFLFKRLLIFYFFPPNNFFLRSNNFYVILDDIKTILHR